LLPCMSQVFGVSPRSNSLCDHVSYIPYPGHTEFVLSGSDVIALADTDTPLISMGHYSEARKTNDFRDRHSTDCQ
jgi:hypothetical protein